MKRNNFQIAAFGGGCFWCLEAVFTRLKGVIKVTSGYAGGPPATLRVAIRASDPPAGANAPTYEEVCSGRTGYAEVVKIEFDPKIISFQDLLTVFFAMHDPTTLNRQGADAGTQYRSIILYENDAQKKEVEEFIQKLSEEKIFASPIVTEIKPLTDFYPAEKYHQQYFAANPRKDYCQINISPKIAKLQEKFQESMK